MKPLGTEDQRNPLHIGAPSSKKQEYMGERQQQSKLTFQGKSYLEI